jgi:hypothetical protein
MKRKVANVLSVGGPQSKEETLQKKVCSPASPVESVEQQAGNIYNVNVSFNNCSGASYGELSK